MRSRSSFATPAPSSVPLFVSTRGHIGTVRHNLPHSAAARNSDGQQSILSINSSIPRDIQELMDWIASVPTVLGYPDLELIVPIDDLRMCQMAGFPHRGEAFRGRTDPEQRLGPMGRCFANAASRSCKDPRRLAYAEGIAIALNEGFVQSGFAIACWHAWCIERGGQVVDPTWPDGHWYHGTLLPKPVAQKVLKGRIAGGNLGYMLDQGQCPSVAQWVSANQ